MSLQLQQKKADLYLFTQALEKMQKDYDQCLVSIHLLSQVAEDEVNNPEIEMDFLKYHLQNFRRKLRHCGLGDQAKLEMKIAGCKMEITYANNVLAELSQQVP